MKNKLIFNTILFLLICIVAEAQPLIDTVWTRQEHGDVLSVSFHPSSQFFATGNPKWFAGMWDVKTGIETQKYSGYPGGNVFFSKTGKFLVQASNSGFQVHDFTNDSLIIKKDGFPDFSYLNIAMSTDEKFIATGDGLILTIWNLETGEKIKEINPIIKNDTRPQPLIHQIEFSPDGTHIAFTMIHADDLPDGIRFINLSTDSIDFEYPTGDYYRFKYSNDGTKIAFTSANEGECIKIMDINTKQIIATIPGIPEAVDQIRFSSDDKYLIYTYGKIIVWDIEKNEIFKTYPGGFSHIDVSQDNKYIAGGIANYLFLLNFIGSSEVPIAKIINETIVYPNPTNNIVTINTDCSSPQVNYKILNQSGQVLITQTTPNINNNLQIDFSYYPAGAYFIQLFCNQRALTYKVIKE